MLIRKVGWKRGDISDEEASSIVLPLLETETKEPPLWFTVVDSGLLQVLSCISKLKLRHFRFVA